MTTIRLQILLRQWGVDEMEKIDLTPFCERGPSNINLLNTPIRLGRFVYASNRHLLVRIPISLAKPWHHKEYKSLPNIESLPIDPKKSLSFQPLPSRIPPIKLYPCKVCNGNRRQTGHCDRCDGTGQLLISRMMKVGGAFFNSANLCLLQDLPGIQIAVLPKSDFSHFKFDGGVGLLSRIRQHKSVRKSARQIEEPDYPEFIPTSRSAS